jgi:hypothetical protein
MPRVVYGLRAMLRSHRIDSPPRRPGARASDRLDACALCHLDGSDRGHAPSAAAPLDDLFAGDPIQRAAVTAALGRLDRSHAVGPSREARMALLLEVMRDDRYPGVRSMAWAALREIAGIPIENSQFSPTDPRPRRMAQLGSLTQALGVAPLGPETHASLRARASEQAIEIGE